MKTLTTTIALLVLPLLATAQSLTITKLENLKIDGHHSEWHGISPIVFTSNDSTPGVSSDGRGPFNHINDLTVRIKLAWNDQGLYAALSWRDDVLDTEDLPKELGRWNHPNGGSRDRMYYYDDFVFRFFKGDNYYYGIWVRPDETSPFQWHSLRLGPRGTEATTIEAPKMASIQPEPNIVLTEIFWSWEQLHFKPGLNESITIQMIATDADEPTIPLIQKERNVRYLHSRQSFIFKN